MLETNSYECIKFWFFYTRNFYIYLEDFSFLSQGCGPLCETYVWGSHHMWGGSSLGIIFSSLILFHFWQSDLIKFSICLVQCIIFLSMCWSYMIVKSIYYERECIYLIHEIEIIISLIALVLIMWWLRLYWTIIIDEVVFARQNWHLIMVLYMIL